MHGVQLSSASPFVYAIFGIQHDNGTTNSPQKTALITRLNDLISTHPAHIDHLVQDNSPSLAGTQGGQGKTRLWLTYWTSSDAYHSWWDSPTVVQFWSHLPDDAGIWREVMTLPASRTQHGTTRSEITGQGHLGERVSSTEIKEKHGDHDEAAKIRPGRVLVTNVPENLCFVVEGQDHSAMTATERDLWFDRFDPLVTQWIKDLVTSTTDGPGLGPINSRLCYDPSGGTFRSGDVPPLNYNTKVQLFYFLDLGYLERFGRRNLTHVLLRKSYLEAYGPGGEMFGKGKLGLWAETSVVKNGEMEFISRGHTKRILPTLPSLLNTLPLGIWPSMTMKESNTLVIDHRQWHIGRRVSFKNREQPDPTKGSTRESHEVYEATPVGISSGVPAIIKIKKQSVSYCPLCQIFDEIINFGDRVVPWSTGLKGHSEEISREIFNLDRLTKVGCSCTPKLIGWEVREQSPSDQLPGGYIAFIVMQKVSGQNLRDFKTDCMDQEHNKIRISLIQALCFIIDFEDVEYNGNRKASDVCLDPWEQLEIWGLGPYGHENSLFTRECDLMEHVARIYCSSHAIPTKIISIFQEEVRKFDTSEPWRKYTTLVAARLKKEKDLNYSKFFLCGAEISSSGRYVTHVLNPVGGIAKKLDYGFRFSDWTAAGKILQWPPNFVEAEKQMKEKRSIPDYTLYCISSKEARALGEAKHPWVNRSDLFVKYARQGQKEYVDQLQRFFWTSISRYKLFYSDAISHVAKYTNGGNVSMRLYLMYLVHTISGDTSAWSLKNEEREPFPDWVEFPTTPTVTKTDSPTASQASQARVPEKTIQLPGRPRNTNQAAERANYAYVGQFESYERFWQYRPFEAKRLLS
ncbi:uncharacterized protein KD926_010106 [Aspergillus affinis]|uniref:uncharacterized protein n=1 Tax=Aspergillus affinis TaxID=1070780 RepID=UPI0022FEC5E5|nr:uncharacterized protein KD926_010106 [Aspergillus affinis]KAI9039004.1 hypothetical protein KD926_010106 [Aspergillus affinis]